MVKVAEGEIVTCENGHPLYRAVRDLSHPAFLDTEDFEPLHPRLAAGHHPGAKAPRCPMCGAVWVTHQFRMSSGVLLSVHFEDGWRPPIAIPRRPDEPADTSQEETQAP